MNINVLETLLFSLHNSAYKALNEIEETILSKDKTAIKRICEVFEPESNAFWKKQLSLNGSVFPVLNIQLFYSNLEDYTVSTIHKGKNF